MHFKIIRWNDGLCFLLVWPVQAFEVSCASNAKLLVWLLGILVYPGMEEHVSLSLSSHLTVLVLGPALLHGGGEIDLSFV